MPIADNVTLDCAGYTLTGPGRDDGLPGINLFLRSGVVVKNCVIRDFNDGVRFVQSHNNVFADNSVSHVRQGFNLLGSDANTLTGNSVTDASDFFGYGLFDGSDNNALHKNTATGVTGVGFIVWGGNGNAFTENDSSNNSGNGFGANPPGTAGNIFEQNTASSNTGWAMVDQTSGGTGDVGTDNTYLKNECVGPSSPAALC